MGQGSTTLDNNGATLVGLASAVAHINTSYTMTEGWRHAVLSASGSAQLWYVDGSQVASKTVSPGTTGANWIIVKMEDGGGARHGYFSLGPWAVWSRPLSANEIATLYADPFCMLRY
jgi:hypothetical protein